MNPSGRKGECRQCGECCRRVRITGILSNIERQHGSLEEARLYYSFRGIRIAEIDKDMDRVSLEMDIPCDKLTAENRCLLHSDPEKKPVICHRYPWFEDDIEDCGYRWQ